ncbi:endolytic transglycosylase MltG [Clostridium sp. Marseille-P299]|uniref:endolytic transglycosylase MltG n=1 Tax=Clostridium sp. Marseille-P299 TaxID=1805477 RepID=UPI000832207D|nr:endolytic transglycosylase MltG [Clostridium sp. Marseille-P299]
MENSNTTTAKLVYKITSSLVRMFLNILFYLIVIMLIVKVGTYTYNMAYQVFGSVAVEAQPGRDVEFQIKKGESTMDIANRLEVSKLAVNKYSFYLKTKLKEYNIMPGTFILNTSMDYDDVLEIITDATNSIAEEEAVDTETTTP